jgi:rhodanese-related sulfurtransferase
MRLLIHAAILALVLFPQVTLAIPPPELIINIGAQVAAVASVVVLFLSAAFTTAYQLAKAKLSAISRKHWIWGGVISMIVITTGSGFGAHFYFQAQAQEELNWYEESREERTEILIDDWFEEKEKDSPYEEIDIEEEEKEIVEIEEGPSFFDLHSNEGSVVSNVDLAAALAGNDDNFILLDARENLEIEAGRIPGATNIRFADLFTGAWNELDPDKYIYVVCASAMRGEEVSSFLREKELTAKHLENGAQSWVEEGYEFDGTIVFSDYYTNWYYHAYLSGTETRFEVSNGAILIDAREPSTFEAKGLLDSIHIALLYTPSNEMEETFTLPPAGSSVITICDDWINCFDAKMTGIELERRGYTFLGRYNKPDEY